MPCLIAYLRALARGLVVRSTMKGHYHLWLTPTAKYRKPQRASISLALSIHDLTPKHTPHPFFDAQKRRSASALVLLAHTFRPYQPTIAVSSPLLITFITRFLSLGINGGDW
ncbi:hypothetical protein L2E82_28495 [Cichorium intybus]|uniref:Uncharacterized protein n=1 Tax=Cichorium intybus TaxID=13427 RepID=A0ACB9CWB0_CICIN|nr:hypothetical protein L2E82_28495 [Cichorium intybus]